MIKKLILTLMTVTLIFTAINFCQTDKGRDPPDPPAVPPLERPAR